MEWGEKQTWKIQRAPFCIKKCKIKTFDYLKLTLCNPKNWAKSVTHNLKKIDCAFKKKSPDHFHLFSVLTSSTSEVCSLFLCIFYKRSLQKFGLHKLPTVKFCSPKCLCTKKKTGISFCSYLKFLFAFGNVSDFWGKLSAFTTIRRKHFWTQTDG